jgi:two-component system, cell cycle response regulator
MAEEKKEAKILIAEDDAVSRRLLESFLKKWGYEVLSASNGLEALDILQKVDAPQLAVLDWMMPGLEGPEVCKRMRQHPDWPYVYILLLTARSEKMDILQGLDSGADDYLTKPFDSQELKARLHVGQRILDLQESLIRAQEELRFRATHDLLTGISNRGVVLDALERENARQSRGGGPFGIVLLDIDHFKYVNDTYGHPAGDSVLKEVARRIAAAIRPYDAAGRYGGEEFMVVAPAADEAGAMGLAERIRAAIESAPFDTASGSISVTASCGAAASIGPKPIESHALIRMADEALYRAKDGGRNRCELAKEAPVLSSLVGAPTDQD